MRDLSVATAALQVDRVLVMAHTDCAANELMAEELQAAVDGARSGSPAAASATPRKRSTRTWLAAAGTSPARAAIAGAVFDVVTGRLRITRRHGDR